MFIETERLIIRSLEVTDEKAYIEMASDGTLQEIFGDCSRCQEWMKDWITEARELDRQDDPHQEYLAYAIIQKDRNMPIGSVGCSYYEDLGQTGITYFIGAKYRGKGYASEAARAYVKYFLGHYDIDRLIATVKTENIASWKTVEKAGFVRKETKMYQDINDAQEELYNFYEIVSS